MTRRVQLALVAPSAPTPVAEVRGQLTLDGTVEAPPPNTHVRTKLRANAIQVDLFGSVRRAGELA